MDPESTSSFLPHLSQRFQSLIWTCIDSDLTRSAVFYAERYFAMAQQSHEARHLYATALLRDGQTYSALGIVNIAQDTQCAGCLELKAKCSTALGRFRQAHEALEQCRTHPSYPSSCERYELDSGRELTFSHSFIWKVVARVP
jgi:anaphase-promoting complex subunit 3